MVAVFHLGVPLTPTPPRIVDSKGNVIGHLTINEVVPGGISSYVIYSILVDLGM